MLCPTCGKEIDQGSSFCPYCGSSLEERQAPPTAAPPAPPPSSVVPPPPPMPAAQPYGTGGGKKKRWLIPVLVGSLVVVVAVVLVLIFVVFRGAGGPISTVEKFFEAIENQDAAEVVAITDMSELEEEPGMIDSFEKDFDAKLKALDMKFKDPKFSVTVRGDEALVKVTGGTMTYKLEGSQPETASIAEGFIEEVLLVKKDGKWLLSAKNFASAFVQQDIKKADKDLGSLIGDYKKLNTTVADAFSSLGGDGVTGVEEANAKFKEQTQKSIAEIDGFLEKAEQLKAKYEAAGELNGADKYKSYLEKRLGEVNNLIGIGNNLKALLNELGVLISGWVIAPPASAEAVGPAVDAVSNKYISALDSLENEYKKLDAEADAMMKGLGLE